MLELEKQIQDSIIHEIRGFIGGPGSLRWPSHELLPALASASGRMCALTLRTANEVTDMLRDCSELVTDGMRDRFVEREPKPLPLVDLDVVNAKRDELLTMTAQRAPYKKPSHLVVGAMVAVLGQLAALRATSPSDVLRLVERARSKTPQTLVRAFQNAAQRQRSLRPS